MWTSYILIVSILALIQRVTHAQHRGLWDDPLEEETASMAPPSFHDTPTVVTVKEGQMAKLECSLDNLGTKKIIWRRKSDLNPLTIGRRTYVDDLRIMVDNKPLNPEWPLIIKQVRKDDAGDYECQVSSKDKLLRRYVQLIVKRKKNRNRNKKKDRHRVPDLPIKDWDPSELLPSRGINITGRTYVEKNQKLRLVCNASSINNGQPLHDLDWFFNGQKLTTDVNKKMTIQKRMSLMDKTIHSVLEIESADMENAGVYICRTSALQITSARVDVLNAGTVNVKRGTEKDAQMKGGKESGQYSKAGGGNSSKSQHLSSLMTLIICLLLSFLTTNHNHLLTPYQLSPS